MKPTQKQLDFIGGIEETTGYLFKGTTKEEASKFISEHIDEHYKIAKTEIFQLSYPASDWAIEHVYSIDI